MSVRIYEDTKSGEVVVWTTCINLTLDYELTDRGAYLKEKILQLLCLVPRSRSTR